MNQSKNTLITGGTGLIGSALTKALLEDRHKVTVLTRSPQKAASTLPEGAIPVKWDTKTTAGWGHLIEETDAVINLAGETLSGESIIKVLTDRWTQTKKERIIASRVNAGKALSAAIKQAHHKPEVFIQSSAVGYYSPSGETVLTEDSPAGSDFSAETCIRWEASTGEVEALGVRRVIIRTGLVFSAGQGLLPLMLLPFRMFAGGPLGDGRQPVPWIHLEDHVNAIRFLLNNPTARGAYNLAAPNPVNYNEFAEIVAKVLGRPNWFRVPAFLLRLGLGEKADLVLQGQHALPQRLLHSGYQFRFKTLEDALHNLTV